MRWRTPVVLTLAALVAVSCDQQPNEPVEQPAATAPTFNFANGPTEAGVVFRTDWELYVVGLFFDTPADPWIIWMGLEPGEAPSWCVGDDERPNAETKWSGAKKGEKSNEVWKMDNVPVTVFDFEEHVFYFLEGEDIEEGYGFCYAAMNATPIGSGEGNYRETGKYEGDSYEWNGSFNGTVDYMGETYRLQFKGKNPYTDGEKNLVARVF